jgi:hypothetical protein
LIVKHKNFLPKLIENDKVSIVGGVYGVTGDGVGGSMFGRERENKWKRLVFLLFFCH